MYDLHIANKNYSSWSLRPWALMTALDIPFTEHMHYFQAGGQNRFDTFSPSALVPCLIDGETTVWDSLAIAEYVAEQHPAVWPADPEARAWARSAAAEMHSGFPALREVCTMNCGIRVQLKERPSALDRDLARIASLWSEGLSRFGGPWLAGPDFFSVDAFFAPVAFRFQTYGIALDELCDSYARRLLDLPDMKAWYSAALAEPYRDAPHEEEARRAGAIVQDLRYCGD